MAQVSCGHIGPEGLANRDGSKFGSLRMIQQVLNDVTEYYVLAIGLQVFIVLLVVQSY